MKEDNLLNTMQFKTTDLDNKNITLKIEKYKTFRKKFMLGFATAIYTCQGAGISQNYNMYDANNMDENSFILLYTEQNPN